MAGKKTTAKAARTAIFIAVISVLFFTPDLAVEVVSNLLDYFQLSDVGQVQDVPELPTDDTVWRKARRRAARITVWIKRKIFKSK